MGDTPGIERSLKRVRVRQVSQLSGPRPPPPSPLQVTAAIIRLISLTNLVPGGLINGQEPAAVQERSSSRD